MVDKTVLIPIVKEIVSRLVRHDYGAVVENDDVKRLSADEVKLAIEEYPGEITMPPDSAFEKMDIYGKTDSWKSVDMDLWYNGSRSDLTLSVRIFEKEGSVRYSVEDIHIL